jgi:nucleoside-diphosphate-sugar epimerase
LSQYAAVIPNFITAVLDGHRPTIYGDGEQSRDFTYIDNVVEANILALGAEGLGGRLYNIAGGERISVNRLIDELKAATGRDITPQYAPRRPGEVLHSQADIQRAQVELGYRPVTTFSEGLAFTLEHYAGRVRASVGSPSVRSQRIITTP